MNSLLTRFFSCAACALLISACTSNSIKHESTAAPDLREPSSEPLPKALVDLKGDSYSTTDHVLQFQISVYGPDEQINHKYDGQIHLNVFDQDFGLVDQGVLRLDSDGSVRLDPFSNGPSKEKFRRCSSVVAKSSENSVMISFDKNYAEAKAKIALLMTTLASNTQISDGLFSQERGSSKFYCSDKFQFNI